MSELRARAGTPALRRTAVGLVVAVAVLATLLVAGRGVQPAGADTVNSEILASCTSPIGPQAVAIPAVVTDNPDPVTAGNQMTISYRTDYPGNVTPGMNIDMAESTWPMPPQVASIDSVTFTDLGTFTADPPVIDNVNMRVTATFRNGGNNRPPTPTINVLVTIDPGATGPIEWKVFVEQRSTATNVPFVGTVNSTCTPRDTSVDQTLNTTTIDTPVTTTTSSTTTTTAPPGPQTCTQTSSADGWTKNHVFGPGGLFSWSNGTGNTMFTTDEGLSYFRSSVKFAGVGGACAEGGTLPAGVDVTAASLKLTKSQTCICLDWAHQLHRITQSWAENNLHAPGGPSVSGTTTATFATPGSGGSVQVSSAQLTADVQGFVDTPANNQGWSIRQRDSILDTGNVFVPTGWATRESSTAAARPTLTITYTP